MSDIYLSLTETPTVVTLSQPVVSGVLSSNVTVTNVVSVNVVTMPAITVQAAAPAVTTVAGTVSISNFPSTQTIAGTVTANLSNVVTADSFFVSQSVRVMGAGNDGVILQGIDANNGNANIFEGGAIPITGRGNNPIEVSGTVTANAGDFASGFGSDQAAPNKSIAIGWGSDNFGLFQTASENAPLPVQIIQSGFSSPSVPISGTVTIGSLPAISGTVTANVPLVDTSLAVGVTRGVPVYLAGGKDGVVLDEINWVNNVVSLPPISGTVTVGNSVTIGSLPAISGTVTARLQDASGNNLTSTSIGGVQRLNVSLASAATAGGTLPSFINIHGGTDGSVARTMLLDSSGRTVVTVSNFPATQPVSLTSTTVTVSSLPSGALTTRFGSVTTANTAQITSAVTNTSRKYLLAQNISTGSVTIGIGFSPTTTQGIQLTAGGGLTFDAFCPTGAVYWLGAVTGAAFTILEG